MQIQCFLLFLHAVFRHRQPFKKSLVVLLYRDILISQESQFGGKLLIFGLYCDELLLLLLLLGS